LVLDRAGVTGQSPDLRLPLCGVATHLLGGERRQQRHGPLDQGIVTLAEDFQGP
jgi:hypothetical protein